MLPLLLSVAFLAGCTSSPAAPPADELQWAPMTVATTTLQPPEVAGTYHLAWREGRFGVLAEDVPGLPVHAIVEPSIVWTSTLGQAWVRWPLPDYQAAHPLAIRYTLWDLPRLLDSAFDATEAGDTLTASLDLDASGDRETRIELRKEAGRVVWGRVETPLDPEAPFTFTREDPHPFPMVPEPALEEVPMLDGDARATQGHQVLLGWVREHHALVGSYPDRVSPDPDSLFLQSINQDWPKSPYDGRPMTASDAEGHFRWEVCSPQDATFTGIGWDGILLEESFGRGCHKAATAEGPLPPGPARTVPAV